MEAPTDNLLCRAARGDQGALVALLERHGPSARRSLAGQVPKRWRSVLSEDDVMQQTFADAVGHICEFESENESAFAHWLTTIAKRTLLNAIKMLEAEKRGGTRKRLEQPASEESFVALWELLATTGSTPSMCVARREAQGALASAIEQLPEAYARVVQMYDLEGWPVHEVARALQRSPGAVFMLRARAHQRLHEIMGRTSEFFSSST